MPVSRTAVMMPPWFKALLFFTLIALAEKLDPQDTFQTIFSLSLSSPLAFVYNCLHHFIFGICHLVRIVAFACECGSSSVVLSCDLMQGCPQQQANQHHCKLLPTDARAIHFHRSDLPLRRRGSEERTRRGKRSRRTGGQSVFLFKDSGFFWCEFYYHRKYF